MGSSTLLSTLVNLCKANTLSVPGIINNDYKALVCILLEGGNDSFNMLIPKGSDANAPEYLEYVATRTDLAKPWNEILPLSPNTPQGKELGIPQTMPHVKQLFDDGNLAFLANIGTLAEPIANATEYANKERPQKLFSHSDQKEQWQTSIPVGSNSLGWGGRTAEILSEMNSNQQISMNISLGGKNIFQASNSILEYSISNEGNGAMLIDPVAGYNNQGFLDLLRGAAVDNIVAESYQNVLEQTIADITKSSLESNEFFASAIANVPPFNTTFSELDLSEDLRMVAKTIAARTALGMNRQIFFVKIGGFDRHNDFAQNDELMLEVSTALSEFYNVLLEMGLENDVTTFTISDFGRTLSSNGNGSDHAWGGNQMVMGGAVNGKDIYGAYPDLYIDGNPLSVSDRGKLIPTTSVDEYFAELVSWFGVSSGDIPYILPNISNFYSPGSTTPPIGFLL